jgi:hypothetical protein
MGRMNTESARNRLAAAVLAAALLLTPLAAGPAAALEAEPAPACAWLTRLGLEPGSYRSLDGEWACIASRLVSLGPPQNTLTYVVLGGESQARELRLQLTADELKKADAGLELMAEAAAILVEKAGGSPPPAELTEAIQGAGEGSWQVGGGRAKLVRKPLSGGEGGFRLHFWLR